MYLQEERANSLARTNHLSTFLLQSSTLMNSPNSVLLSPPGCPHQHVVVGSSDTDRSRLPALYFPVVSEPGQVHPSKESVLPIFSYRLASNSPFAFLYSFVFTDNHQPVIMISCQKGKSVAMSYLVLCTVYRGHILWWGKALVSTHAFPSARVLLQNAMSIFL